MEGQIFTPEGSAILNEIVILFWIAAVGAIISLILEWRLNKNDS